MTRWHPQVPISCVQQQETGSINRNWKMGEKTLTSTAEEKLCKMNDVKGQNSFRGNMKQQRRHIGPPDATGRKLSDAEVQEKAILLECNKKNASEVQSLVTAEEKLCTAGRYSLCPRRSLKKELEQEKVKVLLKPQDRRTNECMTKGTDCKVEDIARSGFEEERKELGEAKSTRKINWENDPSS
ncbi:hypothetical protein Tco_0078441 [Tanacetum coccineum]